MSLHQGCVSNLKILNFSFDLGRDLHAAELLRSRAGSLLFSLKVVFTAGLLRQVAC